MAGKTHWKVLIDTNYFGAYSFTDNVNEVIVTIKDVTVQDVFNPKENKNEVCRVMTFEEEKVGDIDIKPFIINKTNCERIEKLYGTGYIEDWRGKRITLFKTTTKVAGEQVECVRVKMEVPPFVAVKAVDPECFCSVCGSTMETKIFNASVKKYGVAVCSKECLEKYNEENNAEENN